MDVPSIRKPAAFIPVAMSLAALSIVVGHVAIYGVIHEADEGTPAHLFQILMALQVPLVAYFAFKWLPRAPRQALPLLGLQILAAAAAFASVFFLT